jgi:hypothetical protein
LVGSGVTTTGAFVVGTRLGAPLGRSVGAGTVGCGVVGAGVVGANVGTDAGIAVGGGDGAADGRGSQTLSLHTPL